MRIDAWASSIVGLVRSSNQDAIGCFREMNAFVVADGMGGRSEGEIASAIAIDTLHEVLHNGSGWPSLAKLQRGITVANERIFRTGSQRAIAETETLTRGTMATTIVVLLCDLEDAVAHWAHVGDSRLYRLRAGGIRLLTADHTTLGEPYWEAEEAPVDLPHTNRLIRGLGLAPQVQSAIRSSALVPGDLFLLCSDGVSGLVPPDALRSVLDGGGSLEQIGGRLLDLALENGGRDNASVVLVRVLDG